MLLTTSSSFNMHRVTLALTRLDLIKSRVGFYYTFLFPRQKAPSSINVAMQLTFPFSATTTTTPIKIDPPRSCHIELLLIRVCWCERREAQREDTSIWREKNTSKFCMDSSSCFCKCWLASLMHTYIRCDLFE